MISEELVVFMDIWCFSTISITSSASMGFSNVTLYLLVKLSPCILSQVGNGAPDTIPKMTVKMIAMTK